MNWKHGLGVAAIAVFAVVSFNWLFGVVAPGVPFLSGMAAINRGGSSSGG